MEFCKFFVEILSDLRFHDFDIELNFIGKIELTFFNGGSRFNLNVLLDAHHGSAGTTVLLCKSLDHDNDRD